ncbi:MarR family transcriptional regulator [Nocardia yunnanensis]|uniref:MarR family transcriptional regulator n=1 Tax=Nocardia yunnanensis TaxID=2382165 RepID=A0A386ZLM5_9NOCA|nr:MarR family transcriptional regulator [Nocardia yunnanensis]AYF78193.1 MarR family transcriptional regulator [Nocardia yunnanensis]
MTKWLNPKEQRAWRTLVALTTRLPAALDTQLQRESGITHFEFFVMTLLSEEPGHRLQLSELAQKANASLSRLSHVVSKLERLGWAQRVTISGRRGAQAVLTDAGFRKVTEAAPGYLECVRGLVFDGLDAEQTAQLLELGETLVAQLDKGMARGIGRSGHPIAHLDIDGPEPG